MDDSKLRKANLEYLEKGCHGHLEKWRSRTGDLGWLWRKEDTYPDQMLMLLAHIAYLVNRIHSYLSLLISKLVSSYYIDGSTFFI